MLVALPWGKLLAPGGEYYWPVTNCGFLFDKRMQFYLFPFNVVQNNIWDAHSYEKWMNIIRTLCYFAGQLIVFLCQGNSTDCRERRNANR